MLFFRMPLDFFSHVNLEKQLLLGQSLCLLIEKIIFYCLLWTPVRAQINLIIVGCWWPKFLFIAVSILAFKLSLLERTD